MPWAVVGGVIGAAGAIYSSDKQSSAANKASDQQESQFQTTNANEAPWRAAGQTALSTIGDLMGTSGNTSAPNYGSLTHVFNADDLKTSLAPNYQFQLDQGLGATQNAANASGFSGNTLKGINDYAQNYAAGAYQQAYNNYTGNQTNIYNRLSNLAGLGQTANQVTAANGTQAALNAGNFSTSGAAASAAGVVGATNAATNGIGNYVGWNYLNGGSNSPYTISNLYGNRSYVTDPSSEGAQNGMDVGWNPVSSPSGYAEGGPVRKYAFGGAVNPISGYAGWGGPSMMRSPVDPTAPYGHATTLPTNGVGNDYDGAGLGSPFASYAPPTRVDGVPQGFPSASGYTPLGSIGGGGANRISNFGRPNTLLPAPPMPSRGMGIMPVGPTGVRALQDGGAALGGPPGRDQIPAMLDDGEHVFTTDEVTAAGDGSNALGHRRLTYLRDMLKMGTRH